MSQQDNDKIIKAPPESIDNIDSVTFYRVTQKTMSDNISPKLDEASNPSSIDEASSRVQERIFPQVVQEMSSLPILKESTFAFIARFLAFSLTSTIMLVLLLIGMDKYYYYSASDKATFKEQTGNKDIITFILATQTALVGFTLVFYFKKRDSKIAEPEKTDVQFSEPKSSNITFTSKLLETMDEAESQYQHLLSEARYGEAAELAGNIYKMYEKNIESLKSQRDTDEYISAVSWSSYWKLRQDIYKSRSNLIND